MNARNGLILGLLVTVLAGYGFYTLALKPKREDATALSAQIEQQRQDIDTATALLASNEQARRHYRTAYATVVRLGKAVPADDDVRSLVVQLESAARKARVDFASIDVSADSSSAQATTAGTAGFPLLQFSFTFRGPFFRLSDFFERLHGFVKASNATLKVSGRLLKLDSLNLTEDAAGFPKILASVSATTYMASPLEGSTAGATAAAPAAAATATPTPSGSSTTTTTATSTGGIR